MHDDRILPFDEPYDEILVIATVDGYGCQGDAPARDPDRAGAATPVFYRIERTVVCDGPGLVMLSKVLESY